VHTQHLLFYVKTEKRIKLQFLCFVKAEYLKQQISKFYLQILNTEASFYIHDRPLIDKM